MVMCPVFSTVFPAFGACNRLELSPIVHNFGRKVTVLGDCPHGGRRDMEVTTGNGDLSPRFGGQVVFADPNHAEH